MSYLEILEEAWRLPLEEQLRLIASLTQAVRDQAEDPASGSLLDLQGLGKEAWTGVEAQAYVDREREAWNE